MILGGTNDFIMVLLIKKMIFPEYLFYKYHQQCLLGYNYTTSLEYRNLKRHSNKAITLHNKYSQNQFDYRGKCSRQIWWGPSTKLNIKINKQLSKHSIGALFLLISSSINVLRSKCIKMFHLVFKMTPMAIID